MTIKSVEKAISILNCFNSEKKILGVSEISKLTGLTISTTSRLLSTLEKNGCVERYSGYKKFKLGYRVYLWGKAVEDQVHLVTIARPIMENLRDECGEEVSLFVIEGNRRVCVERVESIHEIAKYGPVGTSNPLHAGAAGKVLLSFLPRSKQDKMLSKINFEKVTSKTITNIDTLKKDLKLIKKRGYAISRGEAVPNAFSITAPIWNDKRLVIASISVAGPNFRLPKDKINDYINRVLIAAKKISNRLGYPDV